MNIEINHEDIAAAIQTSATRAIADKMGGYQVREAIASTITDELAQGVMADAIRDAIAKVDHGALVAALSRELMRAMTAATVNVLQEAAVEVVARIRKVPDYGSDRERKIAEVRHQLFGSAVAPNVGADDDIPL